MGSLGSLKRSSAYTVIGVFGLLSFLFLLIIVAIDYFVQFPFFPLGFLVLLLISTLFILLQWAISPWVVKRAAGLREEHYIDRNSNPFVYNTVKELSAKAGIPMPKVAVIPNSTPNAFVFGRTSSSSYLIVHQGLLEKLNKDEIKAVIGHEIGHLKHKDVITMTIVSAIPILAYLAARTMFESARLSRGGGRDRGKAIAASFAIACFSYLIYFITQLMVLHLSRTREYYADSYSASVIRKPRDMMSALAKITYGLSLAKKEEPHGARAFYIGDPVKASDDMSLLRSRMDKYDLNKDGVIDDKELEIAMEDESRSHWHRANELFATHPPTYKRLLMLMEIDREMRTSKMPGNIYKYV